MSETKVRAYQWWCGDEVCDCTKYVIDEMTPRPHPSRFFDFRLLWEGRFVTDSYEESRPERAERLREFRKAAHAHGIRLTKDRPFSQWQGERTGGQEPETGERE